MMVPVLVRAPSPSGRGRRASGLTERKATKIIALLEELWSDLPIVADRYDVEAQTIHERIGPETILRAFEEEELGDDESARILLTRPPILTQTGRARC